MAKRYGGKPASVAILVVTDLAALVIGLWIVLYALDANRANEFVDFVRDLAGWLAGWSHDMFLVDPGWWQVLLNYGIAAVVYLAAGHTLARGVDKLK
ncbi:hypothetical protein SRB5_13670 [Streptomyces sp. RB5]|uniref:Uncharacterized protein n=1 Tax=Streptomyces smaragdinus TaxID=2585196 RepID=A0A7K0CDU9_9ACTN|nr:hypothetical protein [Streptomyces smaragdinus]MQY11252.1 hypothetical protein [Streptomyces smaragdinus]